MSKVTLDRETFKALASETRLQLLHALDERRKTGSELARELDLNKATIHEHLGILESSGLVSKKDEGRKWVYWELTWEGSKLLHPGQGAVFSILLGLSVLATGGGITMLGVALDWWLRGSDFSATGLEPEAEQAGDVAKDDGMPEGAATPREESMMVGESESGFFDDGGWLAIVLLFTAILAVAMAVWLRKRR